MSRIELEKVLRRLLNNGETTISSKRLAILTFPHIRTHQNGPGVPTGREIAICGRYLMEIYKVGWKGYRVKEVPGKYVTLRFEK